MNERGAVHRKAAIYGRDGDYGENRNRQMPRRMRERETGKKRRVIGFGIVCLLLGMNILLLLDLQSQINRVNKALKQVVGQMGTGEQKENISMPEAEKKEEVPNQTYGAVGTDAKGKIVDYVSLCGLPEVDMPIDRSPEEVLVCLEELSQSNAQIAEIFDNYYVYDDNMLKALANNPEMADFVKNSRNGDKRSEKAEFSDLEKGQDYPLFLQWDPRWGYESYGDDNIGLSGCGPTCISMAMYYLLRDDTITPKMVAEYSMEQGYYMFGTGTAWALLEEFPLAYGISTEQPKVSEETMKEALDQGKIIICSMDPGDFTAGGHFVVIYGYDAKGFYINDSNCVARSREKWDYNRLEWQIRHMWIYDKM